MSSFEKYRVHEVAKDLGLSSKVITEILTKHATAPKNHMQVLDDNELSIIFEVLTQEHQCADMDELMQVFEQPKAPEKAAPRARRAQGPRSGEAPGRPPSPR